MGKSIDRLSGALLLISIVFLSVLYLTDSIPAAMGLTVLVGILFRQAMPRRRGNRRLRPREAQAILLQWVLLPEADAQQRIAALIGRTNPVCVFRHPSSVLTPGDVLTVWKNHREDPNILLATTARANPAALAFAQSLSSPSVTIIDSTALLRRIRRSGLTPPAPPSRSFLLRRFCRTLASLPDRHSWTKFLRSASILLAVYLLSGNKIYLMLFAAFLFLAGISLRRQRLS